MGLVGPGRLANERNGVASAHRQRRLRSAILLLLREGESHGYQLKSMAAELDLDAYLNTSSVYQILRQLSADGLVSSRWSTSERGPARRVYALTEHGELHLERSLPELGEMTAAVDKRAAGQLGLGRDLG
jgi:DNA-binding PadR family transcriptional regulator